MEYFKGLSRKEYILIVSELIKRDGIENISIRKLAKEIGCSSASLYRYFESLDELIYYAELGELKSYINALNKSSLVWENVWDKYIGVWYCYAMEAFRKPISYNLIFFTKKNIALKEAINEYYEMFPEDILKSCKICMKAGAISKENAIILNRMVCFLYIGYFKNLIDKGIEEKEIDIYIWNFIDDIERIVFSLADDLQGYTNYREVVKRKIKF